MKPTVNVSSSVGGLAKMKAELAKLSRKHVYVGVPEDKSARKKGVVTNAQLMYLHSNGSALQGIPARPIIEPAIEAPDNKALIAKQLGAAARATLDAKPDEANDSLELAGMQGRDASVNWFTDPRNNWAPNSPVTIARKGSDRPLIDTGELRRSLTYLVEEK